MKKWLIPIVCLVCIAILAAVLILLPKPAHWKETDQGRQYLDERGNPVLGWQDIEESRYYFDPQTGLLITGWLQLDDSTWYLDENGHITTGWLSFENDSRYYFAEDGTMSVGFLTLDGNRYYFDEQGKMARSWTELDGQRYYFSETGIMAVGLTRTAEGSFFFDETGHMVTGWQTSDSEKYYFDPTSGLMVTGWQDTSDGKRYFSESGSMHTGWLKDTTGTFYLNEDGSICTGWLSLSEGTWLLGDDGHPTTGWHSTETARYYFGDDGKMYVGFHQINGIKRYFTSDGNYIPLVNPQNSLPSDFKHELVSVEGSKVDSTCAEALKALIAGARAANLKCSLNSTYRSQGTQQYLWDKRYQDYLSKGYSVEESTRLTARRVAYPGTSEHQLGLAVDISGSDALYAWFDAYAWEYGFIVRYKGEKESYTGIMDEPWHLRYVGKELAQHLQETGYCLEEFYMSE